MPVPTEPCQVPEGVQCHTTTAPTGTSHPVKAHPDLSIKINTAYSSH